MAVWEKIPLEYGVRHHYQSLDGSYPTEVETKYYGDGRIDETITTDATAGEPFAKAVETLDGFEKPFTRNVTVIKGERAVADFYYPRESYEATVNYNVNGVTIKTVTYRLKYKQPIPTPAMDGYTLASEWTETTMPANDNFTLNVEFTPRDDTLYAAEHYVQQPTAAMPCIAARKSAAQPAVVRTLSSSLSTAATTAIMMIPSPSPATAPRWSRCATP